jgi:hypothetical protein
MNKDDLLRLAKNPSFIHGIYNYCDQWCERCAFTSRCMNFALQKEQEKELGYRGDRETFWAQFETIHRETRELLQQLASDCGVPLDGQISSEAGVSGEVALDRDYASLIAAGEAYARTVDSWFKAGEESLRAKEEEVLVQARLGLACVNEEVAGLTDIVQILRWYQHQIPVKLLRGAAAKTGVSVEGADSSEPDGTIKVALIGADRSIVGWLRMKECFPDKTDSILTLLVQLDRLRRAAERLFPRARAFVRPGFDEA